MYFFWRWISATTLAFPLTCFVPGYEFGQGSIAGISDASSIKDSRSVLSELLVTTNSLLVENLVVSSEKTVRIPIQVVSAPSDRIASLQIVCAQGGVSLSDSRTSIALDSTNHIIDITNWDLPNIIVNTLIDGDREVFFTVIGVFNSFGGRRPHSESKNFTVRFVSNPQVHPMESADGSGQPMKEKNPNLDGVREDRPEINPVVDGGARSFNVFVAEAPSLLSLDSPAKRGNETSQAGFIGEDKAVAEEMQASRSRSLTTTDARIVGADPLVERAKGLIRLGDISGARLLLERAQARDAPGATYLLAQTWDPAMLRAWKVHGLRADLARARNLYARAAGQGRGDEQRLVAIHR